MLFGTLDDTWYGTFFSAYATANLNSFLGILESFEVFTFRKKSFFFCSFIIKYSHSLLCN